MAKQRAKAGNVEKPDTRLYTCRWFYADHWDIESNHWTTSCENVHVFLEGGPEQNDYRFCPYCGNTIDSSDPHRDMWSSEE